MTGEELLKLSDELDAYYREYDECFSRSEGRDMIRVFARGQLGPIKRKSLEPIADSEQVDPRALQWFFSRNEWDGDRALEKHQRRVAREMGGEDGIFVIDETSDAKKGHWTAGIERQYCGESGKIDNCIVSVHTSYVRDGRHCLLDGELFLPESWNPQPDDAHIECKRLRARLPEEVVHRPETEMALEQIRQALGNGVAGRYVSADELYGGAPWWRREPGVLKLIYVVEVPNRIHGWIGRRQGPARSLKTLLASHRSLYAGRKKYYRTHETDKGPEVWACRRVVFFEQAEAAPQHEQALLVARNVRTGEVKFFLSNAPTTMGTPACLKVAFSRWRVERCFQDCKGEIGLNHAEIRTWRGLRRHFILSTINYYFLQSRVRDAGGKKSDGVAIGQRHASHSGPPHRRPPDRGPASDGGRAFGPRYRTHAATQLGRAPLGSTMSLTGVG